MSENLSKDGTKTVQRDENGRLLPGSVLNPTGLKPGTKHLTTKLWEALDKVAKDKNGQDDPEGKTYADKLIERIIIDTIGKGNTALIQMVYDRIDGKPDQGIKMDLTGNVNTGDKSIEELALLMREELKKKKTIQND